MISLKSVAILAIENDDFAVLNTIYFGVRISECKDSLKISFDQWKTLDINSYNPSSVRLCIFSGRRHYNTYISMKTFTLSLILFYFSSISIAQRFDNVKIETTQLSKNVYMLTGAGGNIGVSVGGEGVFVIDDQFAPLSEKILAAIKAISNQPLRFLANTHYHGDHTGGNENMSNAGATIIAHNNVRERLLMPKRNGSANPKNALPVITFNDKLNLHINGESVLVFHVSNAHTDGDSILYFPESNVLHTGDTFFSGRYPYIDLNSGGSVIGYIDAAKRGLMVIDDDTKIIPGHGPVSSKEDYKIFLNMLEYLHSKVSAAISEGKSEEDIKNDISITKEYDDLGFGSGFINSERIRQTFYSSLKSD